MLTIDLSVNTTSRVYSTSHKIQGGRVLWNSGNSSHFIDAHCSENTVVQSAVHLSIYRDNTNIAPEEVESLGEVENFMDKRGRQARLRARQARLSAKDCVNTPTFWTISKSHPAEGHFECQAIFS
jgi:hypothetical protein